jgi:hypothetical protein
MLSRRLHSKKKLGIMTFIRMTVSTQQNDALAQQKITQQNDSKQNENQHIDTQQYITICSF